LKGHCFVEVDEPWNLDRALVVLRELMTPEQYAGEDLGPGLLRAIERDLEPCLGKGWLK
jgi:hypothetical protein